MQANGLFENTSRHSIDKIKEFFADKNKLEADIANMIVDFEDRYGVVIDTIRFQRQSTKFPTTVYSEVTVVVP